MDSTQEKIIKAEVTLFLQEYQNFFNENYTLLIARYERFKELRRQEGWCLDTETYLDIIIVQLRSLLVDSSNSHQVVTGNYTVENLLSFAGEDDAMQKIDGILNSVIIHGSSSCEDCLVGYDCSQDVNDCKVKENCTVRMAIKSIADKSICHYDSYYRKNAHSWDLIQTLKKILFEENEKVNIDYIIDSLRDIFKDGIEIT